MRILAFDPGGTTGYAALASAKRGLVLEAAGTFQYQERVSGTQVWDLIRRHRPTLIVTEGWENQGKQLDMHSIWPNRVIGQVEAYAGLLGIHLALVGASRWKPSFGARASLLRGELPPGIDREHRAIAQRLRLELYDRRPPPGWLCLAELRARRPGLPLSTRQWLRYLTPRGGNGELTGHIRLFFHPTRHRLMLYASPTALGALERRMKR